jgi:hypothetical protein
MSAAKISVVYVYVVALRKAWRYSCIMKLSCVQIQSHCILIKTATKQIFMRNMRHELESAEMLPANINSR